MKTGRLPGPKPPLRSRPVPRGGACTHPPGAAAPRGLAAGALVPFRAAGVGVIGASQGVASSPGPPASVHGTAPLFQAGRQLHPEKHVSGTPRLTDMASSVSPGGTPSESPLKPILGRLRGLWGRRGPHVCRRAGPRSCGPRRSPGSRVAAAVRVCPHRPPDLRHVSPHLSRPPAVCCSMLSLLGPSASQETASVARLGPRAGPPGV